jgi:hypothetical protein
VLFPGEQVIPNLNQGLHGSELHPPRFQTH